jgi:hypothetical protein
MVMKQQSFEGLAGDYNIYRSSYPDELYSENIDFWDSACWLEIARKI